MTGDKSGARLSPAELLAGWQESLQREEVCGRGAAVHHQVQRDSGAAVHQGVVCAVQQRQLRDQVRPPLLAGPSGAFHSDPGAAAAAPQPPHRCSTKIYPNTCSAFLKACAYVIVSAFFKVCAYLIVHHDISAHIFPVCSREPVMNRNHIQKRDQRNIKHCLRTRCKISSTALRLMKAHGPKQTLYSQLANPEWQHGQEAAGVVRRWGTRSRLCSETPCRTA